MDFRQIFKLGPGQLAIILFAPLLLTFFIDAVGVLLFYLFLALWVYFLGTELFKLLPEGHKLKLNRFRTYYFATLITGVFVPSVLLYTDIPFETLKDIAPFINILILFCLLNCVLFISKEIIFIKENKTEIQPHEYIGVFISFWLIPLLIGILILQPTIRKIFEEKAPHEENDEEEAIGERTEVELIAYTTKTYNCETGSLTIEQQYHQPNVGEKAFLNGKSAPTGKYKIGFLQYITIVDGLVANHLPENENQEIKILVKPIPAEKETVLKPTKYKCAQGELVIEQEFQMPNSGERVFLNGHPAPSGKYKIGFLQTIVVEDGIVV